MTPYYEQDGITIYHGDCRDVLPMVEADAIVTDPPYGIDFGNSGGFCSSSGWRFDRGCAEWDLVRPEKSLFDMLLGFDVPTVFWGGNYFSDLLPPRMGWIAWDKGQRSFSLADFELAWTSENKASRCVVMPRGSALKDGRFHPTQKPVWVMSQCILYLENSRKTSLGTILDPFMGSGTTLVAAKECGRKAIGIELEEKYCEIAARRLEQGVLPFVD